MGFFPFFPIFFNRGFRLLSANIYCLKLHFRPQGKSHSPLLSNAVQCPCSAGARAALEAEVAPKGWTRGSRCRAAGCRCPAFKRRQSQPGSRRVEEAEYVPRPSGDLNFYWRQNPVTSGDFVKTLSTVQIITAPKARTIKIS